MGDENETIEAGFKDIEASLTKLIDRIDQDVEFWKSEIEGSRDAANIDHFFEKVHNRACVESALACLAERYE